MKFLKMIDRTCFAPIDLKKAFIYLRDGFDNSTNTPTTTDIEPIGEDDIALTGMFTEVPDPAVSTGVSVKFGADDTEYTVVTRTLGAGVDEVQTIEIDDDVSGGTFTLTYQGQTTGAIAYDAAAAVVEAELEALSTLGLGTATTTGASPLWTVTFTGAHASENMDLLIGDGALLTGGLATDVEITETVAGVDGVNEVQAITANGVVNAGTYTITFGGDTTGAIAWDAVIADIELALEALDSIPNGECTVGGGALPGAPASLTFSGTLGKTNLAEITIDSTGLGGGGTYDPSTSTPGVAEVTEVVTIQLNPTVTGGTFCLTHGGNESVPLSYVASAASVEAALEAAPVGLNVAVTGGPGPGTPWVVTWDAAGAQTDITGTSENLTGGVGTYVEVTEVTPGSSATSTARITITPVLAVATTAGGSVTFGGRKLEIKIGEGSCNYSETVTREYIRNRGNLDTVRDGDDEPMDVSFDFVWEFLTAVGGSAVPTIEEVLKSSGEASTWLTTSADPCEPYCVDIEIYYDPGCGGENTEEIVLPYFRHEKLDHNLGDSQVSCTGKCNATEADITRGA